MRNPFGLLSLTKNQSSFTETSPSTPLGLFLRGDLGVTVATGHVTTWADQSGNGRDFTGTSVLGPTQTTDINSKPTLRGLGMGLGGYLRGPVLSLSAAHMFFVLKKNSAGADYAWKFLQAVNTELFPFSDDTTDDYYIGPGSTTRHGPLALALGTSAHVIEAISTSSEWTCFVDGVQIFTTATNTVGWDTTGSLLFATSNNASDVSPSGTGDVSIGEILFYTGKLSSGDQTGVRSMLKTRWNTP